MFIDEQDVVLEASIQMWLEAEVYHDRVVVAVDMGVDTVQALEDLPEETGECLRKGNTCNPAMSAVAPLRSIVRRIHTDAAGKHLLVVDIALHPGHQMLDIFRCRHLGWSLEVLRILPEVLEPAQIL